MSLEQCMRRQRGPQLYISFEYLKDRAKEWARRYPDGFRPKGWQRTSTPDFWFNADKAAQA